MKRRFYLRAAMRAAAAMSLVATCAPSVMATDTIVSTAQTANIPMTGTDTLTVNTAGSVSVTGGSNAVDVGSAATGATITNSGTISAADGGSAIYVDAAAAGTTITNEAGALISASDMTSDGATIQFAGNMDGTLTNNGTIAAHGIENAYAIDIKGDLSGTLTNNGAITANATNSHDSAYATGIYIDGNLTATGKLINNGTITATANATGNTGSSASAWGITVNGNLAGTLTNAGTITATAYNASDSAYAVGIEIDGDISGTLTNDGTIIANAKGYDNVTASGIYVGGSITATGTLTNNGTITVTAESTDNDASAFGIYVDGGVDGVINNTGTITVTANAYDSASAYGIETGNLGAGASIKNSGSINVTAKSTWDSASAKGIYTGSLGDGAYIDNSGTIAATANAYYSATAYGIDTGDLGAGAYIKNSGTITVTAKALDQEADAYGIYTGILGDGAYIDNSGIITVAADGYSSATAYGIKTGALGAGAFIKNSGNITVTANTVLSSAEAFGIYTGNLGEGAYIENSGTITVSAKNQGTDYSATAYGIKTGTLGAGASITNSGTISVAAEASRYWASAYGIYTGDLSAGAFINNSGNITVTANSIAYSDSAHGIYTGSLADGAYIENSGTISVSATGYSSATAYGIETGSLGAGAYINNSGTITVNATSTFDSDATAYGISTGSLGAGASITNSGIISVTATAPTDATAYGIDTGALGAGASITNSGTITATAVSIDSDAEAYGISTGTLGEGASITNSGLITATATSTTINNNEEVTAVGIYTNSLGTNASIINSGTITATASTTKNYSATATGIDTAGSLGDGASIMNSGTITATATAYTEAYAYGIDTGSLATGASITNSGAITATAVSMGPGSYAYAYGISTGDLASDATITNSGTITATATGASGAYAYGINVGSIGTYSAPLGIMAAEASPSSITNSGIITVSAMGAKTSSDYAYGIRVNSMNGNATITNSGTITATAPLTQNAYSIYVADGGEGTSNGLVDNSGRLNGNIYLAGTVNLNNTGKLMIPDGAEGYVGGNYDQSAAGMFGTGVSSASSYGKMMVNGTATLADGTNIRVTVAPHSTLAAGDVLQNVIQGNTALVTGDTTTYNMTDNNLALKFAASNDGAGGLDLTVASTGMADFKDAARQAGLPAGAGAAGVLDSFMAGVPTPGMEDLVYKLGSINTAGEAAGVVEQTLPLLTGDLKQANLDALRASEHVVQERLHSQGMSSGDTTCKVGRQVWLKPFGSWARQNNRKDVSGFDGDTYGLILGADTEMAIPTRLGVAVAYSHSEVDGKSTVARHSADVNTYQAMVYGNQSLGNRMDLDFQANIGLHKNEGERVLDFAHSVASSDYDSTSAHVGVGLSRAYTIDAKNTLVPSVRVDYSWIKDKSYTETGADFWNLNVDSNKADELVVGIDGQWNHAFNNNLIFTAKLGLGYDTLAKESSITASFVGGGAAFDTIGIDPAPFMVRGGLGLVMYQAQGFEFTASYDFEARSDFSNHTAGLKVLKSF